MRTISVAAISGTIMSRIHATKYAWLVVSWGMHVWLRPGKTYRAKPSSAAGLPPRSQTSNLVDKAHQAKANGHVQPLQVGAQLIGRELLIIGDVEIEVSRWRIDVFLDMVHLLAHVVSLEKWIIRQVIYDTLLKRLTSSHSSSLSIPPTSGAAMSSLGSFHPRSTTSSS